MSREPYPCSHAYEHYDDEEGHMRCDECDRIVGTTERLVIGTEGKR